MIKLPISDNDSIFFAMKIYDVIDKIDKNSKNIVDEIKTSYNIDKRTSNKIALSTLVGMPYDDLNNYRKIKSGKLRELSEKYIKHTIKIYKYENGIPKIVASSHAQKHAKISIIIDENYVCYIVDIHKFMRQYSDMEYYCDICHGGVSTEQYEEKHNKNGYHGKDRNVFELKESKVVEITKDEVEDIVVSQQSPSVNLYSLTPEQFYQIAKHQVETQNDINLLKQKINDIHSVITTKNKQLEAPPQKTNNLWKLLPMILIFSIFGIILLTNSHSIH